MNTLSDENGILNNSIMLEILYVVVLYIIKKQFKLNVFMRYSLTILFNTKKKQQFSKSTKNSYLLQTLVSNI